MSLFGKILAILNLFGIIGLMFMGVLAYAKRQTWEYANHRHQTAIDGLPTDDKEIDAQGHLKYQNIGEQMKKDLFTSNPVTTQREEVERVQIELQKALQAKISAATDKEQQSVLLATFLMPLARTNAQREGLWSIRRHLADAKTTEQLKKDLQAAYEGAVADNKANPKKEIDDAFDERLTILGGEPRDPFVKVFRAIMKDDRNKNIQIALTETLEKINADLKEQFDNEFKSVLDNKYLIFKDDKGTISPKDMTPEERKDAISTLLFNMAEAEAGDQAAEAKGPAEVYQNPAFKRYLAVVGLAQANRTINQQAVTLSQNLADLQTEYNRDRTAFAASLLPILEQARESARTVEKMNATLERDKQRAADQQILVNKRKVDVQKAEEELAMYRDSTTKKLGELRKMSDGIFEIRVKVRDATVLNQEHERTIRRLEGWRWLPFVGGSFLIKREEP